MTLRAGRGRLVRALVGLVALVAAAVAGGGCGPSSPPAGNGVAGPEGKGDATLRIVSLSPAISRTLVDFDLADHIVGRTPFCDCLSSAVPVVGDLRELDYERLVRLKPTHILVQPPAAGIDPALVELAGEHKWTIGSWRLNGVDDIESMVRQLPGTLFAAGSEGEAQASATAARIVNAMAAALSPGPHPPWRGGTLMVEQVDPVLAFGAETYLHDILTAVGGVNVVSGRGWVQLSLEDVVRLNPQAVVIVRQGAQATTTGAAALEKAGPLARLDIAAVREGHVAVIQHPDILMPCSAVVDVASELRDVLREFGRARPAEAGS